MVALVLDVFTCIRHMHDQRLLALAGLVCAVGTYASCALATHAARVDLDGRRLWAPVSIVAAGCTAWATHFIILLAFHPGVPAAFDPSFTALSLLSAVTGIGAGMALSGAVSLTRTAAARRRAQAQQAPAPAPADSAFSSIPRRPPRGRLLSP